ncbi:nucleoside-diphosphate-sugar epimerase [Aspergillus bertholletiae]|uniref:Nucleoside-diphosphate-sugar epimerase n=1 Tax=Aspergillus bertholletiae TaxID=1226010 RepID=A0A5N7AU51_9EURO|nr:nucleoside-diphosphate-sugar epimerase [Aspergillus bertholletiae]
MKTVFITGATGYIGGDVLSQLAARYPELTYRVLVRSADKGEQIKAQYPSVEIIYGSLDDTRILESESSNADIIIHTADAADHVGAAHAILSGIIKGHTAERPAYWLHTSGAGIFSYIDTDNGTYGIRRDKVYNDLDGINDIVTIPDHAFHRNVDKIVLDAGEQYSRILKAAIISPTTVYGRGRGPCSQRSKQVYELAKWTLQRKKAPIIGKGETCGCDIHILDLTVLYELLFDAALSGRDGLWGGEAYYLAEAEEHCWGDLAKSMARIAAEKGYIPAAEVESLEPNVAMAWAGFDAVSWGMNVRCRAHRARKLLGWAPAQLGLEEELPNIVDAEWRNLQVTEGDKST